MDRHAALLTLLTGGYPEPSGYAESAPGFAAWLSAIGAVHIAPEQELLVPPADRRAQWEAAGRPNLFPPRSWWPRLGCAALLGSELREDLGEPIGFRFGYRPPRFDGLVKGQGGDHPEACAVDLRLPSPAHRPMALRFLAPFWQAKLCGLSIGISALSRVEAGANDLHLGVWAPETVRRGHQRLWCYPLSCDQAKEVPKVRRLLEGC